MTEPHHATATARTTPPWSPAALLALLAPLAAVVALVLAAPRPVTGSLALLGLALGADRLAARRRRGPTDRALVAVGGALVGVVLAGMLLGSTPLGLSPTSWVLALVVLGGGALLLALALGRHDGATVSDPRRARADRRTAIRLAPWLAVGVTVTAVAVSMTATSLAEAEQAPLQVSLGRLDGTSVQVVVSTTDPVGPVELRTAAAGNEVSYPLIDLGRDDTVTTTVTLPAEGRYTITVGYPDQTKPLRTLVVDR